MVWGGLPGCFWRGLGMLVTQVCGHMRILQGCRFPSRKFCLVSQIWMPPSGVFGRVLAGTRARQYRPTWWILSMAWAENTIEFRMNAKWTQFIIKCPNEERLLECCWVIETFICFIRRVNRPDPHHKKRKMLIEYWNEATLKVYVIYLQYSTHPLEAVLLTGVGPLLCHNHDPLIIKHRHWEHSDPGWMTTEKWGLTHTRTHAGTAHSERQQGCFTEILQFWGDIQEPFFFFYKQNIKYHCWYGHMYCWNGLLLVHPLRGSQCLTSPCKLFSQAPLRVPWLPGHQRCAAARSPSAAPQSSQQQTLDCPVEQRVSLSEENSLRKKPYHLLFGQISERKLFICTCLTGPTNPSRPVRLKGISPMGAPAWLTGITYRLAEESKVGLKYSQCSCHILQLKSLFTLGR